MQQNLDQMKKGLKFERLNTKEGVSPFDLFQYEYRTSAIKNPNGDVVFEMKNVEVPASWSQVATDILAQKYFRKAGVPLEDGSLGSETSIKQVAHRLADCWRQWGEKHNYFASANDAQVLLRTALEEFPVEYASKWQDLFRRRGRAIWDI